MGPRVNAVTAGMTSDCFIEMFRMDVSPLSFSKPPVDLDVARRQPATRDGRLNLTKLEFELMA